MTELLWGTQWVQLWGTLSDQWMGQLWVLEWVSVLRKLEQTWGPEWAQWGML